MAQSEQVKKHRAVFEQKHLSIVKSHKAPTIQDFEIIKPISRGAFGQVYLAKRKNSDLFFALKSMKKCDVRTKNMMEQVVAERDALAISSKSPYVVQLYYSFQSDEKIYLVMEYMIGGDIKSLLHNLGYFDEDMTLFYISEVTLALEYLHSHHIYHRDIKPDNMLLSNTGHVKLTDFGLSCFTKERKLSYQDLLKTPGNQESNNNNQTSTIFWRTPGQLQSLTCKFTFSKPQQKSCSKIKRSHKMSTVHSVASENSKNFVFSPPEVHSSYDNVFGKTASFLSTQKVGRTASTPNQAYIEDSSNTIPVSQTGLTSDIFSLNLENNSRKRSYSDLDSDNKENIFEGNLSRFPKRSRVISFSMPSELDLCQPNETRNEDKKNLRVNVVKFSENVQQYVSHNSKSSSDIPNCDNSDNQSSVPLSIPEVSNNSTSDDSKYDPHGNISGVTALTETSHMSLANVSDDFHVDNTASMSITDRQTEKQTMAIKLTPSPMELSKPLHGSHKSPSLTPVTAFAREGQNDSVDMITPVQMLKFFDGVSPMLREKLPSNNLNEETSIELMEQKIKCTPLTQGYRKLTKDIMKQTPFRTPKSCVRGKATPAEKKRILGTPDYLAPEVLLGKDHGAPVDWWALGVCFYEFLTGVPPFNDDTPELVFQHILDHELIWPEGEESLSGKSVEAIKLLLTEDPAFRPKAETIKCMACFSNLQWDQLHGVEAPFVPQPDNIYDTTYFDARNMANRLQMSDFKP